MVIKSAFMLGESFPIAQFAVHRSLHRRRFVERFKFELISSSIFSLYCFQYPVSSFNAWAASRGNYFCWLLFFRFISFALSIFTHFFLFVFLILILLIFLHLSFWPLFQFPAKCIVITRRMFTGGSCSFVSNCFALAFTRRWFVRAGPFLKKDQLRLIYALLAHSRTQRLAWRRAVDEPAGAFQVHRFQSDPENDTFS